MSTGLLSEMFGFGCRKHLVVLKECCIGRSNECPCFQLTDQWYIESLNSLV